MNLYCASLNKQNTYRKYKDDKTAIQRFKLLAIKRYANLTEISKKLDNGQWSKIQF